MNSKYECRTRFAFPRFTAVKKLSWMLFRTRFDMVGVLIIAIQNSVLLCEQSVLSGVNQQGSPRKTGSFCKRDELKMTAVHKQKNASLESRAKKYHSSTFGTVTFSNSVYAAPTAATFWVLFQQQIDFLQGERKKFVSVMSSVHALLCVMHVAGETRIGGWSVLDAGITFTCFIMSQPIPPALHVRLSNCVFSLR